MNKRLDTITSFIKATDVVADIGSDHGYIPLRLAKAGMPYVYAVENKVGPLNRLKKEVKDFKAIKVELADGIAKLPLEINTLIISGMGGHLIADILTKYPAKLKKVSKLVLAPQGGEKELRLLINTLGFEIIDETVVEDDHFYEIIIAERKARVKKVVNPKFGDINLVKRSSGFIAKREKIINKNMKILLLEKVSETVKDAIRKENKHIESFIYVGK